MLQLVKSERNAEAIRDYLNGEGEPLQSDLPSLAYVMARKYWPNGYDTGPDAPETFEALLDDYRADNRITVSDQHNDCTMFASPRANMAFRAWHDATHIRAKLPFNATGEEMACVHQIADVAQVYGDDTARRIGPYLVADIIGQQQHYDATGEWPVNQKQFDREFLSNRRLFAKSVTESGVNLAKVRARFPAPLQLVKQ